MNCRGRCEQERRPRSARSVWRSAAPHALQLALALNSKLDHERHVLAHVQLDVRRERRRLAEEAQVAQRKCELYGLLHRDLDDPAAVALLLVRLGLLASARGAELARLAQDVAHAEVALDGELDALLGDADRARVADARKVAADTLEVRRRHRDHTLVLRFRHGQLLAVNIHELQLEVGHRALLFRLEDDVDRVALVLRAQGDRIIAACTLEDLAEVALSTSDGRGGGVTAGARYSGYKKHVQKMQ